MKHAGSLRYHLESLRRVKRHTLSETEEQIINVKNSTGRQALDSLYDVITNGLTFQLSSRKGSMPLSREQLSVHFRDPFLSRTSSSVRSIFSSLCETRRCSGRHL